jgi:hypothetical protein
MFAQAFEKFGHVCPMRVGFQNPISGRIGPRHQSATCRFQPIKARIKRSRVGQVDKRLHGPAKLCQQRAGPHITLIIAIVVQQALQTRKSTAGARPPQKFAFEQAHICQQRPARTPQTCQRMFEHGQKRHGREIARAHIIHKPHELRQRRVGKRATGGIINLYIPAPQLDRDTPRQPSVRCHQRRSF